MLASPENAEGLDAWTPRGELGSEDQVETRTRPLESLLSGSLVPCTPLFLEGRLSNVEATQWVGRKAAGNALQMVWSRS